MNQKQLNDLPDEVLLQVFDKMEFKTLLESTLVCKKWNELIGENSAIMNKFKLCVNVSREELQNLPKKLTRKYRSIKIQENVNNEFNWKLLERQASHLRSLEIHYCRIRDEEIEIFSNLIESMAKLETLSILSSNSDNCEIDLSHLNRLKSFELSDSNITMLNFPETAQLTNLNIVGLEDYSSSDLISFLVGQKSLENLSIESCRVNKFNLKKLQSIQFPLKKLSIEGDDNCPKNLLPFMKQFVNSLEEIDISLSFPPSIYEFIFNELPKLETLVLFVDPEENSFDFDPEINLTVRKLTIDYGNPGMTALECLIEKLPNLEILNLNFRYHPKEQMMFIADSLNKLKYLRVSYISAQTFDDVDIPSLKTIRIHSLDYKEPQVWKQMIRALPNIERFEIDLFGKNHLNEKIITIITEGWPQLKHVKFGYGFKVRKEMFDLFLQNCKDLKTVEIYEEAFESNSVKEEILCEVKREGFQIIIKKS